MRVVVVSNRLPVTIDSETGKVEPSSGGLASALRSVAGNYEELVWIGWPGLFLKENEERQQYQARLRDIGCVPVWLDSSEVEDFYNGFSNSSVWPLLHWMTPYARFKASWQESYERVNQKFATAILGIAKPADVVWVHDYHLFMVPSLLRPDGMPKLRVAFFLHTPFPSYEVLCCLPQCEKLLRGVLGADLVGFHTYGYLRHFRSCVLRACGFSTEIDHIDHNGHRTRLGVFPIGCNWQGISAALKSAEFTQHLKEYSTQYEGKSLVLSVERLDYSKGLPQKLSAIRAYLEQAKKDKDIATERDKNPQTDPEVTPGSAGYPSSSVERKQSVSFLPQLRRMGSSFARVLASPFSEQADGPEHPFDHTRTVFLFVAVPSRQNVQEYRLIEEQVHKTISEINGQFSTATYQPIVYIHRGIPMAELVALYARADCMLVTPLIDGMNLVAKEFLAAKDASNSSVVPGTVILSELAGAAQELFDALVVNPYDEDLVANSLRAALEMRYSARWELTTKMRNSVIDNDADKWAQDVLENLKKVTQEVLSMKVPSQQSAKLPLSVARRFWSDKPGVKALFMDYDGTLVEFLNDPSEALPSDELKSIFDSLSKRQELRVFIVSGRPQGFLDEIFGEYKFTLIAEHGYMVQESGQCGWKLFNPHTITDWKSKVRPLMELFTKDTPHSKVEEKTSALVWHYRECPTDFAEFKAKELTHVLSQSLGNLPCSVSRGHGIVEVHSLQVSKGLAVAAACRDKMHDGEAFSEILVIGDDRSDESMFSYAPSTAITVKVGSGDSLARWKADDPQAIRDFLRVVVDEKLDPSLSETPASNQVDLDQASSGVKAFICRSSGAFATCREVPEDDEEFGEDFLELPEEES